MKKGFLILLLLSLVSCYSLMEKRYLLEEIPETRPIDPKTGLYTEENKFEDRTIYYYSLPPIPREKSIAESYYLLSELSVPINTRIYVYGANPKNPSYKNLSWLAIQIECQGKRWPFVKKIHFLIDGYRKSFDFNETSFKAHGRSVSEYESRLYRGDKAREWAKLFVKIGNSENAQMQFEGKSSTKLHTFTDDQKKAYKTIGEVWLKYFDK